jgi:protein-tyrosine kinase
LRTDEKPAHLIERAAARLALPFGEAPADRASPVDTIAKLEMRRLGRPTAPAAPVPTKRVAAQIAAEALARVGMIDRAHRRARIAEEFRIVQNKLLREAFGGNGVAASPRGNVVLVTSALQAEGKSFVSINLASGVARQGDRRVLLVDADVKPTSVGQLLGASTLPGLLDMARSGDRNLDELIVPTAADNLDFLPLGTGVEGSAELFASKRMGDVLDGLSRRYPDRLIILDCAPCLSSSNPHALAPFVGQIILVVAAGSTQQGDVEAALDLVRHCPHVSLLLNKIAPWNMHSFGAYAYPAPA